MDYLLAEVLQRQPEDLRDFLLQTSILDRLTAPLCDAVTGGQNSKAMLERLEASNVFLSPLDHRREWFRISARRPFQRHSQRNAAVNQPNNR